MVFGKNDTAAKNTKNKTIVLESLMPAPSSSPVSAYIFRKDANITVTDSNFDMAIDGSGAAAGTKLTLNNSASLKAKNNGNGLTGIELGGKIANIISVNNKKSALTVSNSLVTTNMELGIYSSGAFALGSGSAVGDMAERFYTAVSVSGKYKAIGINSGNNLELSAAVYGNLTVSGAVAYGIQAEKITGGADFFNKINVTASNGEAVAIAANGDIELGDLNSITVNSKKSAAAAYGVYSTGGSVTVGEIKGAVKVTSAEGQAAAVMAQGTQSNVTIGNVKNSVTVTGSGETYGFYAGKDSTIGGIAGAVKVTSKNNNANGIYSYGSMTIGDITKNIDVTGAVDAFGIHSFSGSINLGNLNANLTVKAVAAKNKDDYVRAYGIYAGYAGNVGKGFFTGSITKNITVSAAAQGNAAVACGFFSSPHTAVSGKITVTATGKYAKGILNVDVAGGAVVDDDVSSAADFLVNDSKSAITNDNTGRYKLYTYMKNGVVHYTTVNSVKKLADKTGVTGFKAVAQSAYTAQAYSKTEAYGFENTSLSSIDMTGKLTVKATDKAFAGSAKAQGLSTAARSMKDMEVVADATWDADAVGVISGNSVSTGTVTIKAVSSKASATATGFKDESSVKTLNVTASGVTGATATGIAGKVVLTKSTNISAKATNGSATAIFADMNDMQEAPEVDFSGATATVSATADKKDSTAIARAVSGNTVESAYRDITISGVSKKMTVSAAGYTAKAYFADTDIGNTARGNIILADDITGTINVTATADKTGGTATAYGICTTYGTETETSKNSTIIGGSGRLGTWNIKATGKDATAYGVETWDLLLADGVEAVTGKITVTGTKGAGIKMNSISYADTANTSRPVLSVNITANGGTTGLDVIGASFTCKNATINANNGKGTAIYAYKATNLTLGEKAVIKGDISLSDSENDILSLTDTAQVTADEVRFGGTSTGDTLNLYSGASLKGASKNTSKIIGLDNMKIMLTDAKKGGTALIQNFNDIGNVNVNVMINKGMTGTFTLANNVKGFAVDQLNGVDAEPVSTVNGIRYELTESGTKYILKATVDTSADGVYSTKQTAPFILTQTHNHFTSAAKVDVSGDLYSCITVDIKKNASDGSEGTTDTSTDMVTLVLDNTVKVTSKAADDTNVEVFVSAIYGGDERTLALISNNNKKSAVTVTSENEAVKAICAKNIYLGSAGSIMDKFYTSVNATSKGGSAYGFTALSGGAVCSFASSLEGRITVSGADSAYGLRAFTGIVMNDINGAVSVTSKDASAYFASTSSGSTSFGDINGSVTVSGKETAYGISGASGDFKIGDITGTWKITGGADAYALTCYDVAITVGDLGTMTVTGRKTDGKKAAVIETAGKITVDDAEKAIKVTGDNAYGLWSSADAVSIGQIKKNFDVNGVTSATGIFAGKQVNLDALNGNMTIKAAGSKTVASAITAAGIISGSETSGIGEIKGKLTVSATSYFDKAEAAGIKLYDGSVSLVKGAVNVTATGKNNQTTFTLGSSYKVDDDVTNNPGLDVTKNSDGSHKFIIYDVTKYKLYTYEDKDGATHYTTISSVKALKKAGITDVAAFKAVDLNSYTGNGNITAAKGLEITGSGSITGKVSAKAMDKGTFGKAEAVALSCTVYTDVKNLEATAEATGDATATAADGLVRSSGTITAKATSANGVATAAGMTAAGTANVLNVTATSANGSAAYATGITGSDITITRSAAVTAKAAKGSAEAALMKLDDHTSGIILTGAAVTVTATADTKNDTAKAQAWGITAAKDKGIDVTGITKTMKVTATGYNAAAYFAYSENSFISISDDITGTVNVTAAAAKPGKNITGGSADAYGIVTEGATQVITFDGKKMGTWNIKATGKDAAVYGFKAYELRINDVLSGKLTVTGTTGAAISVAKFENTASQTDAATLSVNITTSGSNELVGIELNGPTSLEYENATLNANGGKGMAIADNGSGSNQDILIGNKGVVKGDIALWTGDDSMTMLSGSQVIGNNIDFGAGLDELNLYTGAVMKGTSSKTSTLSGVDELNFFLDNADKAGTAMLQNFSDVALDDSAMPDININILEGLTGKFLLASGVANTGELFGEGVDIIIGGTAISSNKLVNADEGSGTAELLEYNGITYELEITGTGTKQKAYLVATELPATSDTLNNN